jgi:DNA-binding transcriptional LysR family regulator
MQVRQLELQTGIALTEQLGKQIHLTEAGEEVFRYARSILQQVDEMDDVLNKMKGLAGGKLRIAAISSANYFAPKLLGVFHQRFHDVGVSMDVTRQQWKIPWSSLLLPVTVLRSRKTLRSNRWKRRYFLLVNRDPVHVVRCIVSFDSTN